MISTTNASVRRSSVSLASRLLCTSPTTNKTTSFSQLATIRRCINNNNSSSIVYDGNSRSFYKRWNSTNKVNTKSTVSPKQSPSPSTQSQSTTKSKSFIQNFLGPKDMPPRNTFLWYREMILLSTVFAITGSSTMFLVRPAVSEVLGLQGSMKDGPWSYRIASLVIMTPLYSILLVGVGTVFGRHFYFKHFSVKMLSRFGIPPEMMDAKFHQTAKNFKKW